MANLSNYIDASVKSPSATVWVDGSKKRDILSIEVQQSLQDSIASFSIITVSNPGVFPEDRVRIFQGYHGKEQRTFTGIVDSVEKNDADGTYTISGRDLLKKAIDTFLVQEIKFGIDVESGKYYYSSYDGDAGGIFNIHEYDDYASMIANHPETADNYSSEGVKAEAVVQWLLVMSGLIEGAEINVDSTEFWIGDITPATFHLTTVYDAIQQICDLIGWYVFCDPAGVVRFKQRPRRPSGYTIWTYSSTKDNLYTVTKLDSNMDLRNYVEVHGASGIKVIAREGSDYLGSTPYRGVVIGNDLIDTSGIATFIASRVLADLNRLTESVTLDVDGNPYLFPGQSLSVKADNVNGVFMIEGISSTLSAENGYKMSITAKAYPSTNGDEEDDGDIEAAFTVGAAVSIGDPVILVQLDGSASYSNRGLINQWSWEFPGGLTEPVVSSEPVVWAAYDQTALEAGVTVNLTVQDNIGNIGSTASGITLSGVLANQKMQYRHLYAALTTKAAGSINGGEVWNVVACPAVSAAASAYMSADSSATATYALFGGSDGKIYKTVDYCQSVEKVANVGGSVDSIHVPENNAALALAATSNGELYASKDFGTTWNLLASFDAAVRHAEFGYTDFDYITVVTAGNPNPGAFISVDGGGSWVKLTDFGDVNMQWYTAGASTPYWAHASGIIASVPEPDPVDFAGGAGPSIIAATVAIDDDSMVMAADTTGQLWTYSGGAMQTTQLDGTNYVRHMIRDGDIPIVNYYATQSGVYKSLDRNTTTLPLLVFEGEAMPSSPAESPGATGWGEMVAYGPLAPILPPTIGRLVLQGTNVSNTVTLSGYTAGNVPVYEDGGDNVTGLFVVIGSGTLSTNVGPCLIAEAPACSNYTVLQAGPSYLLSYADFAAGSSGADIPSFDGLSSVVYSVLSVVDFTPVGVSGEVNLFYPVQRTVGWYPYNANDGASYRCFIRGAQFSRIKNLGLANDQRILVGVYKEEHQGFGSYGHEETYFESFDITPGALVSGASNFTRVHYHALDWRMAEGAGQIYYGTQKMSLTSPSDAVLFSLHGGHPSNRRYRYGLVVANADGSVTFTDGPTYTSNADSKQVDFDTGVKFTNPWRTAGYQVEAGQHVVIVDAELDTFEFINEPEPFAGIEPSVMVHSDAYGYRAERLYKIGAYGTGAAEVIWECPADYLEDGDGIVHVSVTHDKLYTTDYITILVNFDYKAYYVFVSQDGGFTWTQYGEFNTGTTGAIYKAWWVES